MESKFINSNNMITPKKSFLSEIQKIKQLRTPGSPIQPILQSENGSEMCQVLKDRYLIPIIPSNHSNNREGQNGNGSSSDYRCIDIFTEENFLCKIVNDSYSKVTMAYHQLYQKFEEFENDDLHPLIRPVHDLAPLSPNQTYLMIPSFTSSYTLHRYVREKRRLHETEARLLFRQICKTVQLCHRSGVILRDLKLRKFYFIDLERTKLQYESLESAFILDDIQDDTLTEKIGCPIYASPELITTNNSYQGRPADMWALGVIIYTLLVGQYPFNEPSGVGHGSNLFTKIANCDFYLPIGLSCKAQCLIRSLLRKNPEERLKSEDILFHPWFDDVNSNEIYFGFESKDDQSVPELFEFT